MKPPLPADLTGFGSRLRWAISYANLETNRALAARLCVSDQQVSNWLSREVPPSEDSVQALADALDVPAAWLRYGVEPVDWRKSDVERVSDRERLWIVEMLTDLARAVASSTGNGPDRPATERPEDREVADQGRRATTEAPPETEPANGEATTPNEPAPDPKPRGQSRSAPYRDHS